MMKRKSLDDNSSTNGSDLSARKRARSQGSETDEFQDLPDAASQNFTPTKKSVGRPITQSQPSLSIGGWGSDREQGRGQGEAQEPEAVTPSKRGRGRPKGSKNLPKSPGGISTPKKYAQGKKLFATPVKLKGLSHEDQTPTSRRNAADRSARRKTTRALIERTLTDNLSDDEDDADVARQIYDVDEEEVGEAPDEFPGTPSAPETPSKRGRGRPKGSTNRKRSPSPPRDLPPHELYFSQNRGAGMKTSNNNLSSLALLDHEEYFKVVREHHDNHTDDIEFLQELHTRSFNQWEFELNQDFNICVYGWGSKRSLLTKFAEHVYKSDLGHEDNTIVIVNGYVHNTTIRDIISTLASAITIRPQKLGSQPAEMLESLFTLLSEDQSKHITMIVHSIDATSLRRPASQSLLSRLASHPQIHLVASADHPSFTLLWDSSLRSTYNFLFHDCTTFQQYAPEIDVVDSVHELLGRSGRRVGGKEGVSFVLKSLPKNAKDLFRLLVAEQLVLMDDDNGLMAADDEYEGDDDDNEPRTQMSRSSGTGVAYRELYEKALMEFICTNEVSFRTLLKEFHDHQMILSRKDGMGTETLSVPFRKEELETILEDLMA